MGPQHDRVPRKDLQAVYEETIKLLRQYDPDRLRGRDPKIAKALERLKTHYNLKDPP